MFATGIIVAVNEQICTARVQFPDKENMISWDLNVNQTRAGVVWLPQLGERVNCLMDDQLKTAQSSAAITRKKTRRPFRHRKSVT